MTGILLLRVSVRCDVIRTVIFDRIGLFGLILCVALVGRWFTLLYRCFCRGGIWSGAYAAALTASRGDNPSMRPSVPRRRFLLVCPPCIRHVMKWASRSLWAVVPVCLLHRRPYRRCLQKSKSSMSVKSSTVATKWVVGGQRISSSSASQSYRT